MAGLTLEMIAVFAVILVALALFASEALRVDLVAMLVMAGLMAAGLIGPDQGLAGFANQATVTVAAMFVLSRGLFLSGAVELIGRRLMALLDQGLVIMLVALTLFVAGASALVNNTAVVAIMIPTVLTALRRRGVGSARVLLPMSFAAMLGGTCTLLGTSTNILVNSIAIDEGLEPLGMFEFLPLGLIFVGLGLVYLLTIGVRMLPETEDAERAADEGYDLDAYVTDIVILPDSPLVGQPLGRSRLSEDLDLDVLVLARGDRVSQVPDVEIPLSAGDVLRVRCDLDQLAALEASRGVRLRPKHGEAADDSPQRPADTAPAAAEDHGPGLMLEAVVAPDGPFDGVTLDELHFRQTHDATALAIRRGPDITHVRPGEMRLRGGDVVLLKARRDRLEQLSRDEGFVVLSEPDETRFRRDRMLYATAVVVGVVALAASGLVPVVVAAILGALAMILTGCLRMDEAYEAIEWKVIFLLAGVLSLGAAMQETGAADWLAGRLLAWAGEGGEAWLLAGFLVLTSLLTAVISNNAAAALLAPVAIQSAGAAGADPRPFLMAVTYAASLSFMTPIGYQTNTLVYGAGPYRFRDFLIVGTPLNVLLWIVGALVIPLIWPFHPTG